MKKFYGEYVSEELYKKIGIAALFAFCSGSFLTAAFFLEIICKIN